MGSLTLQNFSGSGGQASMPDIYAFQSAVIDFVENTPWIEAAFPFGKMNFIRQTLVTEPMCRCDA